jgi:multiple sugar transport system substrate-binding protein
MTTVPFRRGGPLLAALALIVSACGTAAPSQAPADSAAAPPATQATGGSPAPEARTLQLWRIFNECASQYEGVTELGDTTDVCAVQQIHTNQWNAEHPETQVETTALVWPGIVELNAALAGGTPPDVFSLHAFRIPSYASKGALTPLGPYLEEAGVDVDDLLPNVREAVSYNGEIYGIPMDVHGILAHINLDLWEQAGLVDASGKPMIPTSLAEFEAACRKVKDATGGPLFAAGDDDIVGTAWVWASLYAQLGGSSVDAEGMPSVDTPESREALATFLRLRDEGCFVGGELAKNYEGFVGGTVASVLGGTWMVNEWDAQVRDPNAALKNYYVAPMPQLGGKPAGWGGSHTWVVPLGADADPDRVRAAVGYIKHTWDRNLDWTRTGHATVRRSVLESPEYLALPHKGEYLAYGDTAIFNPATNWSVGYDQVMHEEVQAALLGDKSPEQALIDAQARLVDVASLQ